MSSKVDPSLRVVKQSGVSHDDSKESSSNNASGARVESMRGERAALASPGVGTDTLLGVPAFPAGNVDGAQLFVSPATVTAIAKTKYPTDPSLKRITDPSLKRITDPSLKKLTDPSLKVIDGEAIP